MRVPWVSGGWDWEGDVVPAELSRLGESEFTFCDIVMGFRLRRRDCWECVYVSVLTSGRMRRECFLS